MLGIVAAFREEVQGYLRSGGFKADATHGPIAFYRSASMQVVMAHGAVGREKAQQATSQLIKRYAPDVIVSAGFAGAVREGLRPGDLFICDRLMLVEGPAAFWRPDIARTRILGGMAALSNLYGDRMVGGKYGFCGCLTVPRLVASASMKAWIGNAFPVNIVDMESYWVSEMAAEHGVPQIVVRSVLDPVHQSLPSLVQDAMERGNRRITAGEAVRGLLKSPADAPRLLRLASQVRRSRQSLADFLMSLSYVASQGAGVSA